jgi:DNA-binding NarL/FixJ family response regulator
VEEQRAIREERPPYNLREQTDLGRLSGTVVCEIERELEPHVTWRYAGSGAEQSAQREAERLGAPPEATKQQRRAYVKRLRAAGVPVRKIAADLNLCEAMIYRYLREVR